MNFIYIEHEEYENIFETISEAEEFLMEHRKDGNEFYLTWRSPEGDVLHEEGWMYFAPTFIDQDAGEFKISPHAAQEDYDKDSSWISSDPEDGDIREALESHVVTR